MYTYLEAGEVTDLDLRYSVLCQAALAAPVLLEHSSGSAAAAAGGSGGGGDCGTAAQPAWRSGEQQQQIVYVANDWPTALLLLRLQYTVRALGAAAAQEAPAPCGSSGCCSKNGTAVADVSSLQQLLEQRLGASAAAVFCIHNLAYQGVLGAEAFARLSLPAAALPALCTSSDWREVLLQRTERCASAGRADAPPPQQQQQQQQQQQECDRQALSSPSTAAAVPAAAPAGDAATAVAAVASGAAAGQPAVAAAVASCFSRELNQMRSALLAADCLVTVSRGYAVEVQQEGPFGCGLHNILAARGIRCADDIAAKSACATTHVLRNTPFACLPAVLLHL